MLRGKLEDSPRCCVANDAVGNPGNTKQKLYQSQLRGASKILQGGGKRHCRERAKHRESMRGGYRKRMAKKFCKAGSKKGDAVYLVLATGWGYSSKEEQFEEHTKTRVRTAPKRDVEPGGPCV